MPVVLLPGYRRKVYIPVYKHMFYMSEQQCYSSAVNCKYYEIPQIGYTTFLLFCLSSPVWSASATHALAHYTDFTFLHWKKKKNEGGAELQWHVFRVTQYLCLNIIVVYIIAAPSFLMSFCELRCYLQFIDSHWRGCCLFYKVLTFYLLKQNLSLALCSLSFMSLIE